MSELLALVVWIAVYIDVLHGPMRMQEHICMSMQTQACTYVMHSRLCMFYEGVGNWFRTCTLNMISCSTRVCSTAWSQCFPQEFFVEQRLHTKALAIAIAVTKCWNRCTVSTPAAFFCLYTQHFRAMPRFCSASTNYPWPWTWPWPWPWPWPRCTLAFHVCATQPRFMQAPSNQPIRYCARADVCKVAEAGYSVSLNMHHVSLYIHTHVYLVYVCLLLLYAYMNVCMYIYVYIYVYMVMIIFWNDGTIRVCCNATAYVCMREPLWK